jgi:hypothetical protein
MKIEYLRIIFGHSLLYFLIFGVLTFQACQTKDSDTKTTDTEQTGEAKDEPEKEEPTVIAMEGNELAAKLASLDAYSTQCGESLVDLAQPVKEIATNLEAQNFEYASSNLADCSGMFHRVLKNLKKKCPSHAYPKVNKYRDSRALAKWYQENKTLLLVNDALAQSDLIKPGAVLFYGYGGKNYQDFSAEDLFVRGTGINHVGVVVEVTKNEQGEVESYRLFHGRNPKYTAGITDYHLRKPTRDSYPPLGNGPEQWVAFAPIVKEIVE